MVRRGSIALCLVFASAAGAHSTVSVSPDITIELDASIVADENVAVDNLLGITINSSLGALPEAAEVTAYHYLANGDQLFALDTTVSLAGPVAASPRDVVRYDGVAYSIEFDGAAAGVPNGARVDAVSRTTGGDLLLSFDTTVNLGGTVAADEDLVTWNGASFAVAFDGSAQGIDPALDLDATHDMGGGVVGISFDAAGSVGGVAFSDEDVLLYDAGGPTWKMAYDGSAQDVDWVAADLGAVVLPEPRRAAALLSGVATLIALSGQRRRR